MKTISGREAMDNLLDNGLLFEINRQVLHPLGFALRAVVDAKTNKTIEIEMVQTDDPTGIHFDEQTLTEGFEKLEKFMTSGGLDKLSRRLETLGYIVQDDEPTKTGDA